MLFSYRMYIGSISKFWLTSEAQHLICKIQIDSYRFLFHEYFRNWKTISIYIIIKQTFLQGIKKGRNVFRAQGSILHRISLRIICRLFYPWGQLQNWSHRTEWKCHLSWNRYSLKKKKKKNALKSHFLREQEKGLGKKCSFTLNLCK